MTPGTNRARQSLVCMERDDVKHSFYLHIMRTSLGRSLREYYGLSEPLPDRVAKLLKELEEPRDVSPVRPNTDNVS